MLETHATTPRLPDSVSREFLLRHRLCPIEIPAEGPIRVAVDPDSILDGLDDISVAYRRPTSAEAVPPAQLDLLIERVTTVSGRTIEIEKPDSHGDGLASDMRELVNQPPVVRYLNMLVRDAHDARASDIHLQAAADGFEARLRVDGVLVPALAPPSGLERAVVSRAKLLADLDIAERRRPQDGRIRVRLEDRELDLRVSTVPTMFGESLVVRLLDRGGGSVSLTELGLPGPMLAGMSRLARRPHGLVLAVGPTGSGKTTTLYAALGLRDPAREKIITIEDPVEYALPGVTQVPVHPQAGVTFPSMLRSILRQDPDVIMVGEMRDEETAEIAVQAALTGHLVLSTLHTGGAISAIPRLIDLGVPPYLVAATLEGVLAQRLVRRLCPECSLRGGSDETPRRSPSGPGEMAAGHASRHRMGAGCEACRGTGYRGRTGIFELLTMTPELREAIADGAQRTVLERLAADGGTVSLRADGRAKAEAGITTIEEVVRVTIE